MSDPSPTAPPRPNAGIVRLLSRLDDGEVVRWTFRAMLAAVIAVLGFDVYQLHKESGGLFPMQPQAVRLSEPILPPAVEDDGGEPRHRTDPRDNIRTSEAALEQSLRMELGAEGVLSVEGTIDIGAAQRFEDELARRGEYIRTVSLNSPGGSLDDALAIARLIREHGLATKVEAGALCASSCPLVLAGGMERSVSGDAAIGLHQFYAAPRNLTSPAQAMADAQLTAARISRYLAEMEVDPTLWLHALDTPPRELYYLTPEEMRAYDLVTTIGPLAQR